MRKVFFISLIVFFYSCISSPEKVYNNHGIYFISPEGWQITYDKVFENGMWFIAVEKYGLISSGNFNVFIQDSLVSIDKQLKEVERIVSEGKVFDSMKVRFFEQTNSEFKGKNAIRTTFEMKIEDLKYEGEVICFKKFDKTICLLTQGEKLDKEDNIPGFETFLESFDVK